MKYSHQSPQSVNAFSYFSENSSHLPERRQAMAPGADNVRSQHEGLEDQPQQAPKGGFSCAVALTKGGAFDKLLK
jgi:hypothetical protein